MLASSSLEGDTPVCPINDSIKSKLVALVQQAVYLRRPPLVSNSSLRPKKAFDDIIHRIISSQHSVKTIIVKPSRELRLQHLLSHTWNMFSCMQGNVCVHSHTMYLAYCHSNNPHGPTSRSHHVLDQRLATVITCLLQVNINDLRMGGDFNDFSRLMQLTHV